MSGDGYYRVQRRTIDWVVKAIDEGRFDDARVILCSMVDDERLADLRAQREALERQYRDGLIGRDELIRQRARLRFEHP